MQPYRKIIDLPLRNESYLGFCIFFLDSSRLAVHNKFWRLKNIKSFFRRITPLFFKLLDYCSCKVREKKKEKKFKISKLRRIFIGFRRNPDSSDVNHLDTVYVFFQAISDWIYDKDTRLSKNPTPVEFLSFLLISSTDFCK